jgi:hypothetical protein
VHCNFAQDQAAFKRQLYQSQIAQALVIKTEVEAWRSTNNFGTLFWMYNEAST